MDISVMVGMSRGTNTGSIFSVGKHSHGQNDDCSVLRQISEKRTQHDKPKPAPSLITVQKTLLRSFEVVGYKTESTCMLCFGRGGKRNKTVFYRRHINIGACLHWVVES